MSALVKLLLVIGAVMLAVAGFAAWLAYEISRSSDGDTFTDGGPR